MDTIYIYIATFLGGALLVHLWEKFIHRISILRYTVYHQHIALSSNIPGVGTIEVLHNKSPVKNIYLSTAYVNNDTNRDLSNIEISLTCDSNSTILFSQAVNKSNGKNLNFTNNFSNILSDSNHTEIKTVDSSRDYLIPVINRGDIIEFSFLIVNNLGNYPVITAFCEHLGVKIKFQKAPRQKLFGESTAVCSIIGLIITSIICYFFIYFNFSLTAGVWLSFILGLTASVIGFLFLKLFKLFRRLLT